MQPRQHSAKTLAPSKRIMTGNTCLEDMRQFLFNCQHDVRLTPQTQLVFWTLMAFSNKAFWTYPIVVSDSELKKATHITSNNGITNIKRHLKNLGYIDFEKNTKPTKYTLFSPPVLQLPDSPLYSPPVQESVQELVNSTSPPPTPPT